MDLQYYTSLYTSYFAALLLWVIVAPKLKIRSDSKTVYFNKPWFEFLLALLAAVVTVLIGQLYMNDYLVSEDSPIGFLGGSLNQLIIFSPFFLLLFIRRQSLTSAWIPVKQRLPSIGIGLVLALIAILLFVLVHGRVSDYPEVLGSVYSLHNLSHLVQVFCEDFAIAVCFVRFAAMIGQKWAVVVVAGLFAAAHIPAMVTSGISVTQMTGLIFDAILAAVILTVLMRWKNFLWFWMVHFAMDMMQFEF